MKHIKSLGFISLITLSMSVLASQDLEKGKAFYRDYNYSEAFTYFSKEAERNNAEAIYYLGNMYRFGESIPKDLDKAEHLYQKAFKLFNQMAQEKDATAVMYLGQMYHFGNGTKRDTEKGIQLFLQADKLGNGKASSYLASYFERLKEPNKAFYFAKRSAERGERYGRVAKYYETGYGTEVNYEKAFEFYKKAAENKKNKELNEISRLSDIYLNGELNVPQDYDKAIYWLNKLGNKRLLGLAYQKMGKTQLAKKYLTEACEEHDGGACFYKKALHY
ncbi:tetratricopeptide repeat protein [Mannheimia sp. HC-2023]|uniref:tetratricopeptide repeat protein n=1 Tax=Mannheimia indoligenes TaxID=3103145 RepID=UPI002FE6BDE1